jgi:hypothetical protein
MNIGTPNTACYRLPMSQLSRSIREVLLETIEKEPKSPGGGPMDRNTVLEAAAKTLGINHDPSQQLALLSEWNELFRTGVLGQGKALNTLDPPWFHVTKHGRQALEHLSRDPSNPAGYMRQLENLQPTSAVGPVAKSYVVEALACYVTGLYKASAVMIGAAAEATILDVRHFLVKRLKAGTTTPSAKLMDKLESWQIKTVTDGLQQVFEDRIDKKKYRQLREKFEAHWSGLTHEIRTTRNDAGHPTSIDPVTPESVHASLLMFPVLAGLAGDLVVWVSDEL